MASEPHSNPPSGSGPAERPAVGGASVLVLALPILAEQLLVYSVEIFDTWLAGRISEQASSVLSVAAYTSWLGVILCRLASTGALSLIARCWGAADVPGACRALGQAIPLAFGVGMGAYVLLWLAAPWAADALGLQGRTRELGIAYLRVEALGHIFQSVSLCGAAALRATGDMRTPLWILGGVNLINMIVAPLLVFFGGLEVWGIVSGTLAARVLGGVAMLAVLFWGRGGLRLRLAAMRPDGHEIRRIMRIGVPHSVDGLLNWFGHFAFFGIVARSGGRVIPQDVILAAHFVGIRVEGLTYLPAHAWGLAAATIVGQSLGAGRSDDAARGGNRAALQASAIGLGAGLLYFLQAATIYQWLTRSTEVWAVGIPAFQFMACFQLPVVLNNVYANALAGAGDTRFPILVTILGTLCVRVPAAYVGAIVLEGGLLGAWVGMSLDNTLRSILLWWRFQGGTWKTIRV
jgi:putative MATE family efflux protein